MQAIRTDASALIALARPDQFRSHPALARDNGMTRDGQAEINTHHACHAGWQSADAATTAKGVFRERQGPSRMRS